MVSESDHVICMRSSVTDITLTCVTIPSLAECPVNFYFFNGRCIHHLTDFYTKPKHSLAREYCSNITWYSSGHLFVPTSFYDYQIIRIGFADIMQ
jgi:hypothetical protein